MRALRFLGLLGVAHAAHAAPADLAGGAERFAGAPVLVDARIGTRACPPEGFQYAWAGPAVEARCPATGERMLLPLATPAGDARLKRGDSVQADFVGNGFRVTVGAVAEGSARDGRMTLRNSRSGQRFAARLDRSGRIIVPNSGD